MSSTKMPPKKIIKEKEEVVPEKKIEPKKEPTPASQTRAHSITLTKINDVVVKPVKTGREKDTRLPKGFKMFPEPPELGMVS
jgi:hypothetical protein